MHGLISKDIEEYGKLKLTKEGQAFLKKSFALKVAINHNFDDDGSDVVVEASGPKAVLDPNLFKMLKDLQQKTGKQHNLPPYVIFQEFSLEEMAAKYPITIHELTEINGVSKGKAERYGKPFIALIAKYVEDNDIDRPTDFKVKSVASKGTEKIKIIQAIDKRIPVDEIAKSLGMKRSEFIDELESIVNAGTKVNIDYYLNNQIDEELLGYIYDYFRESKTDSIDAAYEEFKNDGVDADDLRLVRVKFMSEMAN